MAARIRSMGFLVKQIMLLLQQLMDGYRFGPTEEELINYLKSEEPGCREGFCIIPTVANIYEINPSDLRDKFSEESIIPSNDREWWFICPQMQNQRISRKTPCGSYWKITGTHKHVIIDGKQIGFKTTLVFPDGRGSKGGKSDWVIHEYRLLPEDVNKNYVLCHLKDKQDEKADNSTTTSEHGVIDLAELESILNEPDDDVSFPEKLIQARMKDLIEPSQHQNQVQFSLPGLLHLFKWGLRSQNNSFRSSIHQSTNFGSPSFKDFSMDNSRADRSIELGSLLGTAKEDERFDPMPNADLFYEVQKGEGPRLEKVQQDTAARNIISLDERAARAELNGNYVLCRLKHGQDEKAANSTTESEDGAIDLAELESLLNQPDDEGSFPEHGQDEKAANSTTESEDGAIDLAELESLLNQPDDEGSFPEHLIQAKMKSLVEPSQHQNQVQFSLPDLLQLRSQNNSFPSTIHQFTNIGSPSVNNFLLDNSLTDISIELESLLSVKDFSLDNSLTDTTIELEYLLRTTQEDNELVDAMLNLDSFYAKVQKGEESRLEKVQKETAARNIEPWMSMDETAARAKNGHISITENSQSNIEPLDDVFPLEKAESVMQMTFNSSHFSEIGRFCASSGDSVATAEGQRYEEHNLAGNSPKRRRLNMPEKSQIR